MYLNSSYSKLLISSLDDLGQISLFLNVLHKLKLLSFANNLISTIVHVILSKIMKNK